MKNTILLCLLVLAGTAGAQTVEVIRQSDFKPDSTGKIFAFLEPSTDTSTLKFVATIKATGDKKHSGIDELFFKIKKEALERGALFFKLNSYHSQDSTGPAALILDTYYGTDSIRFVNFANHEKNVFYIFGVEKSGKAVAFKINNDKRELQSGTYYKQALEENKEVKINKGGFTGATLWLNWKPDRPATFLSLTGFGLGGAPLPPGMTGMTFNTGRIQYVDGDLGHLMVSLLSKSE